MLDCFENYIIIRKKSVQHEQANIDNHWMEYINYLYIFCSLVEKTTDDWLKVSTTM